MIVHKNERGCVQFKGALRNLSWIDGYVIDGPTGLFFIGDENVFPVKKQNTKLLGFAMRHGGMAIVEHGVPARYDMLLQNLGACHAVGRGLYDFEIGYDRIRNSLDLGKPFGRSGQYAIDITESFKQRMGQWFDIAAGNRPEEDQFQQLVIGASRPRRPE